MAMPLVAPSNKSPFYQVRKAVPAEVRHLIEPGRKIWELWASTKTADKREAERKARLIEERFARKIDAARARLKLQATKDINSATRSSM